MKRNNKKNNKINKKIVLRKTVAVVSALLLVAMTAISVFALYVENNVDRDVDLSLFEKAGEDSVTRLYSFDKDGNAVEISGESLYGHQVTVFTPIENMPKELVNAFISIEDKRFYAHDGVDWYRTVAAGFNYMLNFRDTFGASTITQQLIKNVTGSDELTINRKLQEIFYALDLEKSLDKDEILELYLNIVNLSQGCYGVGAAAEKYFSKSVSELNLSESASLAAITQNPSYYDPIKHPDNNKQRRDVILFQMLAQKYISEQEYESAVSSEIVLNVSREASVVNSWYTDMVVEDVITDLTEQLGYTRAAASYLVYNGGLKIYTAMDPEVQAAVEEYYEDESNFPEDDREEGRSAVIVIDPTDGDILGVAGCIGEKTANRVQNYATDTKRPSGSSIKPISVYAPALEEGLITWASVYDDIPIEFIDNGFGGYTTWPNNATNTYRGLSNIRYAVQNSLNTVSVKVLDELGIDKSYEYVTEKFHIENLIERDKELAPLALGQQTYGVTLREMTAAYSVFANGGVYNKPRSYVLVMSVDGDVLLDNTTENERVISEGNAAIMTQLLKTVVSHGSTSNAITLQENVEVAGKTGTTQDTCDRWFIGYTPYYICGVWYGHEYPSELPSSTLTVCSTAWNGIMSKVHEPYISSGEIKSFEIPENVISSSFCCDSGLLMTGSCMIDPRGDRTEVGWFVDGTQPKSFCECHVTVNYDKVGGGVASELCPSECLTQVGLVRVDRDFPMQIYVTDAQYVWKKLPDNLPMCSSDNSPFFTYLGDDDHYFGISDVRRQFNSGCPDHYSYPW